MTDEMNENLYLEATVCKAISGQEDENGNYVFEVEASNENLDLQNQITLQTALEKSQEYFITNGVISDDHLHKTRNPDGSVETNKDKIIGEPVSVRFDKDSKKTFVKGILYAGIKAAKPYIELLKNKSRLVKASIGGIMPKIKHNNDGTETVTSFMWNDLALTCSPVNWTVGSARFAKAVSMIDFCKSLNAGSGTDAATMTDGRSMQNEDLEEKTEKLLDITDGNIKGDNKNNDIEKSQEEEIIEYVKENIKQNRFKTIEDVEIFFIDNGFTEDKASEIAQQIFNKEANEMKKSHFSSRIQDLLKSFKDEDDIEKSKDDEEQESLFDDDDEIDLDDSDEEDDNDSDDDDKEVEKCSVKKSFDDNTIFMDGDKLFKEVNKSIDELREENETLKKSIEETQIQLEDVTNTLSKYLRTPQTRKTVIQKSIDTSTEPTSTGPMKRPTNSDFEVLKSCLVKAAQNNQIGLSEVQYYNSEFQKAMNGIKIAPDVWNKICSIVKSNR